MEQLLEFLVGLADSMMAASIGAAVSDISLVDQVMALLISLFAALATGGCVVAGQYLGAKRPDEAGLAVNQLVWIAGIAGVCVMALLYLLRGAILRGLFGSITREVYGHAHVYLLIVAASVPFVALYNAGAALFRTTGNSRLPMQIMLAMNLFNIGGSSVLVRGLGLGTAGIAIPTLVSRLGAEATHWTTQIAWSHAIVMILIWLLGNAMPAVFRACGDARFPMVIRTITMFLCRVALAYLLVSVFDWNVLAAWIAIYCDWLIKGSIFVWRYLCLT